MKKRICTAFLLVLILSLLSACGSNSGGQDNHLVEMPGSDIPPPPLPVPQNYSGEEEATGTPARARDLPVYGIIHRPVDLGGRVITVVNTIHTGIPFSGTGEEPDPATADNYLIERMIWDNAQRVKRSFNFVLEETLLPNTPISVLRALALQVRSGEYAGDIAFFLPHDKISAIVNDIILPLGSVNLPNSDVMGPQFFGYTLSELFGESWGFTNNAPNLWTPILGVNLEIINAIGAPNPLDLYHRGQWTWDAWLDIMRLATQDTTGSGRLDQFGIAVQPLELFTNLIMSNDGSLVTDDLLCNLNHPNTVEALQFAEQIINEGLLEYNIAIPHVSWQGRLLFRRGNSAFFFVHEGVLSDGQIPFEFTTVPFPTGPRNTTGTTGARGWSSCLVFPRGSNWDQSEILMVVEEFWTWSANEPELIQEFYLNRIRNNLPAEEDLQRLINAGRNAAFCAGLTVHELSFIFGDFTTYFLHHRMTALEAVNAHTGLQQVRLDSLFRP